VIVVVAPLLRVVFLAVVLPGAFLVVLNVPGTTGEMANWAGLDVGSPVVVVRPKPVVLVTQLLLRIVVVVGVLSAVGLVALNVSGTTDDDRRINALENPAHHSLGVWVTSAAVVGGVGLPRTVE